ncbi:MAG: lasso peptide biosynthesis B2 protein [Pseudorhodobacter sp.]|nr:lasso peptide biosynthesis B2 protein [Frankiaceae bacterium]
MTPTAARLVTAAWAAREVVSVRRQLPRRRLQDVVVRPAPYAGRCRRTVMFVLRATGSTCLPRALLLQRCSLDAGRRVDLVVGVRRKDGAVMAHAWLEPGDSDPGFTELHRLRPGGPAGA